MAGYSGNTDWISCFILLNCWANNLWLCHYGSLWSWPSPTRLQRWSAWHIDWEYDCISQVHPSAPCVWISCQQEYIMHLCIIWCFYKSKELVLYVIEILLHFVFLCSHLLPDYSEEQEGQGDYIIYTYIHTYIHTYICTYIDTYCTEQKPTGISSLKHPSPSTPSKHKIRSGYRETRCCKGSVQ